jgi:hypothetical protein
VHAEGSVSDDQVVVEGVLARDGTGRLMIPFRSGDVLKASGPFVETVATSVSRHEVILRWPWRRIDPASQYGWTGGEYGFPFDDLHMTLYRTEPPMQQLRAGQRCRVGIPPTLVHVVDIAVLDTPEDTGMLPRPSGWISLLRAGTTFTPRRVTGVDVELIAASEPDGPTPGVELAEPIRMELVFRPYAFLADGDVVTDRDGRRWRFEVPFWWQELDGPSDQPAPGSDGMVGPAWPLALASDDGEPDPARSAKVAAATASGSHAHEVARWKDLTNAEPVPITPYVDEDD